MAEIIDVSVPLSPSTVTWENESVPVIERVSSIEAGDGFNLSRLAFGVHTGTHVDAPSHFIDGAGSVESVSLDALIGPALVVDARDVAEEIGVRLVGIYYLSVGEPETHRELLSHGVVLLEGLDLREIEAGRYRLICLPLN